MYTETAAHNPLNTHAIEVAIRKLDVEERQLIYLADREKFTYEQIGHILQINIGTIRSRLNTLGKKLITLLRDQANEL
ncbi:MAG: RNA polymerase sigma-70 factor (ECF subfamily) [Alphaproteobacteria bacterium]|jgi:RNA polymerase sigma-70 factor (ECF subfamily)